jgi:hypothetical protein
MIWPGSLLRSVGHDSRNTRPRARLTILFPSGAYPTVTDATHRSGRCPTKDRRHRGFYELASGSVRFLFEKRDVLLDRGCRDQPYTALGYGSQATCADLLVDNAAAQGQHDHDVHDPVQLLLVGFARAHVFIGLKHALSHQPPTRPSRNSVSIRKSGDGARLWSFSDAETVLAG